MSERYYDWQKAILSEMPSLADEDVSDKLPERAIVRFVSDENGRPISRSYKKVLIVDKFTKNKVSPGDAWLCTLAEQSSCIVAYPDQKITTEMLAGLDKRLFDSLVDEIWEHHRELFEQRLDSRARQEFLEKARSESESQYKSAIEDRDARIEELESELGRARFMVEKLSAAPTAKEEPVQGSESERPPVPAIPREYFSPAPGLPETANRISIDRPVSGAVYDVYRPTANVIMSPSFTDRTYFIHISRNGHYLIVRPHDYGNITCTDGIIRIRGLGTLAPFQGPCQLDARYSQRYAGLLIRLDSAILEEGTEEVDDALVGQGL